MEAHALVARLAADVPFPFLCMLVSGGHNMLLVAHAVGDYTLMGSTLDDSVGRWAADVHPSCFTAPLFMTTELKHVHWFSMSIIKVCSVAYHMPCDHFLTAFAVANYTPVSVLRTTQIYATSLNDTPNSCICCALSCHISVSGSRRVVRLPHVKVLR